MSQLTKEVVTGLSKNQRFIEQLERSAYYVQKVAWEDTNRDIKSCWGKNITDMTLVLSTGELLDIIRKRNFSDNTFDIKSSILRVPVENGSVPFPEFLQNITKYVPGLNVADSLWHSRDEHLLAASQVCVLPMENDSVNFGVQIYNYQSSPSNPAVLTIMVTARGTSVQVIQGKEVLYHNDHGHEAWLTARRLKEVRAAQGNNQEAKSIKDLSASELDNNQVLIFQVPLQVQAQSRGFAAMSYDLPDDIDGSCGVILESAMMPKTKEFGVRKSAAFGSAPAKMDFAQLAIGNRTGGRFSTFSRSIRRDQSAPIRVTIQGYITTDSPNLTDIHGQMVIEMLERMRKFAEASGSLVLENSTRLTKSQSQKEIIEYPNLGAPLNLTPM